MNRSKRIYYFTDKQMIQISHAINYTKYLRDSCIIVPAFFAGFPKIKQLDISLKAASKIVEKEMTQERLRRSKK